MLIGPCTADPSVHTGILWLGGTHDLSIEVVDPMQDDAEYVDSRVIHNQGSSLRANDCTISFFRQHKKETMQLIAMHHGASWKQEEY